MTFDALFTSPHGRISRAQFIPALLVLIVAVVFFAYLVKGRTATFCMLVLVYPGVMLHARRLHDMGRSAWLLLVPVLPLLGLFAVRLKYASFGSQLDNLLPTAAFVLCAAVALWGTTGRSRGYRQEAPVS